MNVLVLLGSLRASSTNGRLAEVALSHLPAGAEAVVWGGLAELPHYSEDLDGDAVPPAASALRSAVAAADAVILVTPEYNGSLPSTVKNAIDWLSRPRGDAALAGKPVAVLAASGSPRGAQWAREDAVRILGVAGAVPLAETVGVGSAWEAFDDAGALSDPALAEAVRTLIGQLTSQALTAAA